MLLLAGMYSATNPLVRIVLVSPSLPEREALEQLLVDDGHQVRTAMTDWQGLDLAVAWQPDAFIADVQVGCTEGLALIHALSDRGLKPRVVLLCPRAGCGLDPRMALCLTKPIDLEHLRRALAVPSERQVA